MRVDFARGGRFTYSCSKLAYYHIDYLHHRVGIRHSHVHAAHAHEHAAAFQFPADEFAHVEPEVAIGRLGQEVLHFFAHVARCQRLVYGEVREELGPGLVSCAVGKR